MDSIAEALSKTALVFLVLIGILYFFYGRAVFFPFFALVLSPLAAQKLPETPRPFVEAGMLALGHLALLGVEYAGNPEALLGGGAAGAINLFEVALVLVGAPLLMLKGWRAVAGALIAFQLFGLLPILPLALLNIGSPEGWTYLTHAVIRVGLCALLVQGWRAR